MDAHFMIEGQRIALKAAYSLPKMIVRLVVFFLEEFGIKKKSPTRKTCCSCSAMGSVNGAFDAEEGNAGEGNIFQNGP